MPKTLNSKLKKGGPINPKLFDYVFSGVWRYQLPDSVDMKAAIGKVCSVR